MSAKFTPWFSGRVKPVRIGVYQRLAYGVKDYSFWNGEFWCFGCNELQLAGCPSARRLRSGIQEDHNWRGLVSPSDEVLERAMKDSWASSKGRAHTDALKETKV